MSFWPITKGGTLPVCSSRSPLKKDPSPSEANPRFVLETGVRSKNLGSTQRGAKRGCLKKDEKLKAPLRVISGDSTVEESGDSTVEEVSC